MYIKLYQKGGLKMKIDNLTTFELIGILLLITIITIALKIGSL